MANKQNSKYTMYLLILIVAIILVVGLLSINSKQITQQTGKEDQSSATKEIKTDTAVATVSFVILPPGQGGNK